MENLIQLSRTADGQFEVGKQGVVAVETGSMGGAASRWEVVRERLRAGLVIPAHPLALTAERALDDRFDLREFHDVVLLNGAVTLNILDANVDAYIARVEQGR